MSEISLSWLPEVESEVECKGEGIGEEAWDDVHGGSLPVGLVKAARKEEVNFMNDRGIWSLRPIEECWEKTGKNPVSVRWVDTNKNS